MNLFAYGVVPARFFYFALLVLLTSCTTVPTLQPVAGTSADPDNKTIPITEVVKRVKCELFEAVSAPVKQLNWFSQWTAKVDLELTVNEQSNVTPVVSFIHPLHSVSIPGVGNFSRAFNFGINGDFKTTAARTEKVGFTLSFSELKKELEDPQTKRMDYQDCILPEVGDLNGNLGLKEWIDSALGPAVLPKNQPYLRGGHHAQASGGSRGGPSRSALSSLNLKLPKPPCEELQAALSPEDRLKARYSALAADVLTKGMPKGGFCAEDIAIARERSDSACQLVLNAGNSKDIETKTKAIETDVKAVADRCNPPIDTISHQVQFIVSASAGISPGWALVHFKGPSPNSNSLAGVSQSNTHTLTILLGPASSPDVQALQTAFAIRAAIQPLTVPQIGTAP